MAPDRKTPLPVAAAEDQAALLPDCRHRGAISGDRFSCASPWTTPGTDGRITADRCLRGCRHVDHGPDDVPSKHPLLKKILEKTSSRPRYLDCVHHGPAAKMPNGRTKVRVCETCEGVFKHQAVFHCFHPDVAREVTVRDCTTCRLCELPNPRPAAPATPPAAPPSGKRWAYGVTSIEARRKTLLPLTLAALAAGGFDRPHLFADGTVDHAGWRRQFGLDVTSRHPAVRCAGNWILTLWELYHRDPHADRYAVFQDDLTCVRGLREYLDAQDDPKKGYWNLLTFPCNQLLAHGRVGWYPSDQRGQGAVALVFGREALTELLSSRHLVTRTTDPHRGWRAIDGGIVTAMNNVGYAEYVHNPSLVQHTGYVSSMCKDRNYDGVGPQPLPNHRWAAGLAPSFPGDDFDARELLTPAGKARFGGKA